MIKVLSDERIPIKLWLDDMEDTAIEQAKNLANLPFAFKHIAIMPDAHMGYGMPIGGVLATKGVVIPNAVGVDIGCGMCSLRLNIDHISKKDLILVRDMIKTKVPVGKGQWHVNQRSMDLMPPLADTTGIVMDQYQKARYQIGTLGAGNHFIEIQKGSDDMIYIMIHSGSRNIGYKVAQYYNKLAITLNKRWFSIVPAKQELAYLPIDTPEAKEYMAAMQYCVEFAFANRKLMMEESLNCFQEVLDPQFKVGYTSEILNIAHNYAAWENHYGTNVIVHRKGATRAYEGELGIIPGSQGTTSYIVRGLGNEVSFKSCSHGAGRNMGRIAARKNLNLDGEIIKMGDVIHDMDKVVKLDEAPGAYKDIEVVMANQTDLAEIVTTLTPLAVIKG